MRLARLWLTDFRSYASADIAFAPGLTALLGQNGEGKTNVMEAIGYLATLSSFRGAPNDALVRAGASSAVVRAEGEREGRQLLIEAEIAATGRGRVQVNKQKLARTRDLLGALRISVFAPDDLELVKGGPAERRRYLDDTLVARRPSFDSLRSDLDRILRQRNALLKQSGGRLSPEVEATLMVWDAKLVETGEALADARDELVQELGPALESCWSPGSRQRFVRRSLARTRFGRGPRGSTTRRTSPRCLACWSTSRRPCAAPRPTAITNPRVSRRATLACVGTAPRCSPSRYRRNWVLTDFVAR